MFLKIFATIAILVISYSNSWGSTLTGPILNSSNNHYYYLLSSNTWTASQAEAVTLGGSLATVNDNAENQWILDTFGSLNGGSIHLWIGYNDFASEGNFVWSSAESSTYENWTAGEPNNKPNSAAGTRDENFTFMWRPGTSGFGRFPGGWNDYANLSAVVGDPAAGPIHGVVEAVAVVPIPAAVWLLGAGLISIIGLKRKFKQ